MASKEIWKNYSVVLRGKNFILVHKPTADPFDEKDSRYFLVLKKYGTIEAAASSYIMACDYLTQAEEMYLALNSKTKLEVEAPAKPTQH